MQVFVKTDETKLWWVFCHEPDFYLGPYPREDMAFEVKDAIERSYTAGKEQIQSSIKEALGL